MKRIVIVIITLIFGVIFANKAKATDFGTALNVANENIPAGADVAGIGGADTSLGYKQFSTSNPAGIGAYSDFRVCGTINYLNIGFKSGPTIQAESAALDIDLKSAGVIELGYINSRSDCKATKMGIDAKLSKAYSFSVLYGLKIANSLFKESDKLYIGAGTIPVSKSKVRLASEGFDIANSKSDGYTLRTGVLYVLNERFAVGSYYSYSHSKDKDTDLLYEEEIEYHSKIYKTRIGASYQILPGTLIATDWQYLKIGDYEKGQIFAGIEQRIVDPLYLYAGWAADGPTCGLGIYLKNGGVNVAYMYDNFNATHETLGKSQSIMIQAYLSF